MKRATHLMKALIVSAVLVTAYPVVAQTNNTARTEQADNDDDDNGKWGLAGLLGLLGLLGLKRKDDNDKRRVTTSNRT